ncbi:MAG: ArsR family transcriptional regulator, partial [Alphaproteobacteria bacterium]
GLAEHQVLIGPRGMGKTSLLRRVQILIRAELADRFVPLTFREEQYNVLRLGDVWRNCAESLAEWAEAVGDQALADRLDQALLTDQWGDDSAGDQFAAELAALDRRAVLLVDNLDLVLGNLSPEEQWIFRRYLQAPRGPVVVGAATHPLALSADRNNAFYEFFHPHYLHPLSQAETEQCLRTLAIKRGDAGKPVLQVLGSAPARVRTLHRLTGGNPRVLALIYRLLESAETDAAMGDLEALLDQVTPYYKSRIEEYQTAQQRAVIDAIALHWDPVTVGEISKITGVPTTTLSGQLKKLRQDGLIEEVEVSAAAAGHQLVERFLNIWYLMRHGTRRT